MEPIIRGRLSAIYYLSRAIHDELSALSAEQYSNLTEQFSGENILIQAILEQCLDITTWAQANIDWDNLDEIWEYYLEETIAPLFVHEFQLSGAFPQAESYGVWFAKYLIKQSDSETRHERHKRIATEAIGFPPSEN